MKFKAFLFAAFAVCASLVAPTAAQASRYLQCVPYAREMSGIDIHGNAKTWWGQAAGVYERGSTPREGSVMNLPGYGKMRLGHVAMVSKVVNDREILLSHANWSRRGGIERNVRAVDVSDKGDWSRVKIWFAGIGDLGLTSYPVNGFIYPNAAKPRDQFRLGEDVMQMARLESGQPGASSIATLR
jgi:surface antigen